MFISNGEVINGKAGAIEENEDGTYTDIKSQTYGAEQIKSMLKEEAN